MSRERWAVSLLLVATFAIRAIRPDQPIVENYVGRQIPTAMVARNLERGSGFLHPQLDTGPFPNLFLVEPPIYAQLVAAVRPIFGFELEPTGRLVSAASTVLAAWGLFGLARRREGAMIALVALGLFCCFPVMVRYGRAFQPDALMLGCVLAGLRGWDEYEESSDWRWAAFGGFVLSTGLALKITVGWALIPFFLIVRRWPLGWRVVASIAMLAPALAWYLYAWGGVARVGSGSLASSDNASLWVRTLSPWAWLRFSTYTMIGRGLVVRSFTPIGFVLAIVGMVASGKLDRVWKGWAVGCALAVLALSAKWHHSYYWMVVAPLAAVGTARGLVVLGRLGRIGRPIAVGLGSFFLALCGVQSVSTWQTPEEWTSLIEASRVVSATVPDEKDRFVVAPEALLHYADRRGFRLEFAPEAIRRAVGEWGESLPDPNRPLALVEFYRRVCGRENDALAPAYWWSARVDLIADVGPTVEGPRRKSWREAVRASPDCKLLIDRPGLIVAEFR